VSPGTVRFGGQDVDRDAEAVTLVNVAAPDLSPVARLPRLRELRLAHTNPHRTPGGLPVDLDPLAGAEALEVLVLRHYPVRDIGPLRGLRRLRVLDLGFTPLDDIGPLDDLPALEDLDLRATPVATLEPLHGRNRLARLDIAHTRVADLRPLHGLPALRVVEVEGAPVTPEQVAALVAAHDGAVDVRV
jgi:internalin A